MDLTITAIFLSFSLVLIIAGYAFDSYILKFIGGGVLIMMGLFIVSDPLVYDVGTNTTIVNATYTTIRTDYTRLNAEQNYLYSSLILLTGMAVMVFSIMSYYKERQRGKEDAAG